MAELLSHPANGRREAAAGLAHPVPGGDGDTADSPAQDDNGPPVAAERPHAGTALPGTEAVESTAGSAATAGSAPRFWETLRTVGSWIVPPAPVDGSADTSVKTALDALAKLVEKHDLPVRAAELLWMFETMSKSAALELERLCRAIDPRIQDLRKDLEAIHKDMAKNLASAGLTVACKALPNPGQASDPEWTLPPEAVEDALRDSVYTADEIAGGFHVATPVQAPQTLLARIGTPILAGLTIVGLGSLMGLCFVSLLGLVSSQDLRAGDGSGILFVASLLGSVVVYRIGLLYEDVTTSLAVYLEPHYEAVRRERGTAPSEPGDSVPPAGLPVAPSAADHVLAARHRSGAVVLFALVVAALIVVGEAMLEATGFRMLHLAKIMHERHFAGSTSDHLFPFSVYLVLGTVFTVAFAAGKAARAWRRSEDSLRAAWLASEQRRHLDDRRLDEPVRAALEGAYRAERITADLRALRLLRDAARTAASGEADRFHEHLGKLVEGLEPMAAVPGQSKLTNTPEQRSGINWPFRR